VVEVAEAASRFGFAHWFGMAREVTGWDMGFWRPCV
jgi:hypothetical protein